ncbi:MAG TPA: thiamine pyrophosphate-dependent enzyme, partial [Pirellulales bacterium]|nr:thiamine pyrophosphate-dependent enzyme [Pirellulales bacterium]
MLNRPRKIEPDFEAAPNSLSLGFVEQLYASYLQDPASVSADWRRYFKQLGNGNGTAVPPRLGPSFRPSSVFNPPGRAQTARAAGVRELEVAVLQDRVDQLVRAYRVRGHMVANIDPLGMPRPHMPELDPDYYGFTEADMDRPFSTVTIRGPDVLTLRRILERLRNTYCRSIAVQFMHIDELGVRQWLQDRMEGTENRVTLSKQEQLRILTRLTDATIFEEFIQKRFTGAKSFSLEGAESLIPLLDLTIEKAGDQGIRGIVLGMAHRGRLNVLANIMGKSAQDIFREFADIDPKLHLGRGDVKYHLGYSSDWITAARKKVHLSLCFNPSHLEFVGPVAVGRVRAKQDRIGDAKREHIVTLLIHGDAAFAGEGVVQETFNLSQLEGYKTGGTIHVIVNNQIGFVTSPSEGRSSTYATDVAKMLQIPIFHVNGEDPEAVAQVVRLAMDFRHEFKRDVVIDMYCYRRRGHNESDEPAFTHPLLYRAIEKRKSVREGYLAHL